jgi:putative ABC transport system substrate-binding protein
MPVIGFLNSRSPEDTRPLVAAFRRGLSEHGYVEGQTVTVEYRWGFGQYDRLPALAAELVRRPVALLVATGGEPAALAAKAASSTIPIAFVIAGDPVQQGLAASYNRPGGNATGFSILSTSLEPKRLGLLNELVPKTAPIGILMNRTFPQAAQQLRDVQAAAAVIGRPIQVAQASSDGEIDQAFEHLSQGHIAALIVAADPFYDTRLDKLIGLAARHALPAMYQSHEYAAGGGLMSYGIDMPDAYREIGGYAGRILKGEKPADLPVQQPTKFEFIINLSKLQNCTGELNYRWG